MNADFYVNPKHNDGVVFTVQYSLIEKPGLTEYFLKLFSVHVFKVISIFSSLTYQIVTKGVNYLIYAILLNDIYFSTSL